MLTNRKQFIHIISAILLLGVGFPASATASPNISGLSTKVVNSPAWCRPSDGCNVRSGPGKNYPKVGKWIKQNAEVNVVSSSAGWSKISSPRSGWIRTDLLDFCGE